jgi:cephalosporin hydroxylase
MADDREAFEQECRERAAVMAADTALRDQTTAWINAASAHRYTYNFRWLGAPIIQFPQDIVALQEIIWNVRPELIVETGIARGGSVLFYASMLELLGGDGRVVGVDIDIRDHNRDTIESHPLSRRVELIEGSSTAPEIVDRVAAAAAAAGSVMVVLDSNHTHEHVLRELRAYAPVVTSGSYLVVLDTIVEEMPDDAFPDRPWGRGDNPMTALDTYLNEDSRFEVDTDLDNRLLISVAPRGYLRAKSGRPSDGR